MGRENKPSHTLKHKDIHLPDSITQTLNNAIKHQVIYQISSMCFLGIYSNQQLLMYFKAFLIFNIPHALYIFYMHYLSLNLKSLNTYTHTHK